MRTQRATDRSVNEPPRLPGRVSGRARGNRWHNSARHARQEHGTSRAGHTGREPPRTLARSTAHLHHPAQPVEDPRLARAHQQRPRRGPGAEAEALVGHEAVCPAGIDVEEEVAQRRDTRERARALVGGEARQVLLAMVPPDLGGAGVCHHPRPQLGFSVEVRPHQAQLRLQLPHGLFFPTQRPIGTAL